MYLNGNAYIRLLFTHMFLFMFFVTSLCVKRILAVDISFPFANVKQGRQDLLQEQFPDLPEFSEVQLHLNTFILSCGTKQTSGATGKGIRCLVSSSFPYP